MSTGTRRSWAFGVGTAVAVLALAGCGPDSAPTQAGTGAVVDSTQATAVEDGGGASGADQDIAEGIRSAAHPVSLVTPSGTDCPDAAAVSVAVGATVQQAEGFPGLSVPSCSYSSGGQSQTFSVQYDTDPIATTSTEAATVYASSTSELLVDLQDTAPFAYATVWAPDAQTSIVQLFLPTVDSDGAWMFQATDDPSESAARLWALADLVAITY